jgi:hypothetical protein
MQVIGYADEVDGDVMGDVMGDDDDVSGDVEIVGYDDETGHPIVSGRKRRRGPRVQLTKPGWRRSQLAPGVIAPDQGLLPLPLGSFTYVLAAQTNTFVGQVQKPFRGERLLVTTVRTGASAVGRVMGQMFVGSDLAALDVPSVDLEQIGAPNAFGVRLTMKPIQPGVQFRIITTLSNALAGADTIFCTIQLLGRNIG